MCTSRPRMLGRYVVEAGRDETLRKNSGCVNSDCCGRVVGARAGAPAPLAAREIAVRASALTRHHASIPLDVPRGGRR